MLAGLALATAGPAGALTIELKDTASDRVERQRAYAEGRLPLAGTPNLAALDARLAEKGLKLGAPVMIRIFKAESELELWMRKGDRYELFATYPMCHWSGTLGPKVREGDKQNPEGFYTVTERQLHLRGRWPRSLNLGFPNPFDRAHARTGSYILVHGGCSSVGCFAMTNAVVAEIYDITEKALKEGQEHVQVHAFPFRMTDANLAEHKSSEWYEFWRTLKEGYDAFEQTRLPPHVAVCERRYVVTAASPSEAGDPGPLAVCGETLAALAELEQSTPLARDRIRLSLLPPSLQKAETSRTARRSSSAVLSSAPPPPAPRSLRASPADVVPRPQAALPPPLPCNPSLASCRRWSSRQTAMAARNSRSLARASFSRVSGSLSRLR